MRSESPGRVDPPAGGILLFRDGPNGDERAVFIRAYFQHSFIPAFSQKVFGNIQHATDYCGCGHPPAPNSSTAVLALTVSGGESLTSCYAPWELDYYIILFKYF